MRKSVIITILLILPLSFSSAQSVLTNTNDDVHVECNTDARKLLHGLCAMVGSRMKDKISGEYLYKNRIFEAACIDENDSEEIKFQKIRKMWAAMEEEFVCDSTQFDVLKGNILKYAVSSKFDEFIEDLIEWRVNLNRVDSSDNRTVLDYISFHIDRNKGNALEPLFQHYYKILSKAGAKHKHEL